MNFLLSKAIPFIVNNVNAKSEMHKDNTKRYDAIIETCVKFRILCDTNFKE